METFSDMLSWMSFNVLLAVIPVIAGFIMWKIKNKLIKITTFLVWFFFVPNTIYLFTDLMHVGEDISHRDFFSMCIVIGLYLSLVAIGLFTFLLSMYTLQKFLHVLKIKKSQTTVILFIELVCIAFGMVLGRVERANSWDILSNPTQVVHQSQHIITSAPEFLLFTFFFVLVNITYFSSKEVFEHLR